MSSQIDNKTLPNKSENKNITFSLSCSSFMSIPFHKYEKNFTFIVDGKRYEINRVVADILSPIIKNYHYQDESINEFVINTIKTKKPDSQIDYFQDFLNIVNQDEIEIDLIHQELYCQYFLQLGNHQNYLQIKSKISEKIDINNCVNILKSISTFIVSQNPDDNSLYDKLIKFIAINFEEISKDELKTLDTNIIEDILTNDNFQIQNEDTLLKFALEMYLENSENASLFEYVIFNNVSEEQLDEFLNTFSIDDLDSSIWRSIIHSFQKVEKRYNLKEIKCLMLGIDNSGKTQILYKMVLHDQVTTIPTLGFNQEDVVHKNVTFKIWDMGGQERLQVLWSHHYQDKDALIFVVDSSDYDRLNDARDALSRVLNDDAIKGLPLLIWANKADLNNSLSEDEIENRLGLNNFPNIKWRVIKSSVINDEGLDKGLDYILDQIKLKRKKEKLNES